MAAMGRTQMSEMWEGLMPFVDPDTANRLEAEGVRVVRWPSPPPDGFLHYAMTARHTMCNAPGKQEGVVDKTRVTCPECLRMMKRTGR